MDGDSGRVLYEKEGYTARPNASTTKVMTCILALEKGSGDDYVMVSENAASQPEVKLNLKERGAVLPGRSSLFFNVEKP